MKYTILTGEQSGDQHAARLVMQIKSLDKNAIIQYTGGSNLDKVGHNKILDISEMSFMGFYEVLINLGNIYTNIQLIKKSVIAFKPDVVIFIDYPGMNLNLSKWAKRKGFKTVYYILPKAWAWKASRAKKINKYIDLALSIFPFELPFYSKYNVEAIYVGNPSYEAQKTFKIDKDFKDHHSINKPILALIPGSRIQEIKRNLNVMLEAAQSFKDYQIVISKSSNLPSYIFPDDQNLIISEDYNNILAHADFAFVTSGTATLDAAIWNVPQVVIYKSSTLSMMIAKSLIKIKYISLVNLICGREVVTELIQEKANKLLMIKKMQELMNLTENQKSSLYNNLTNKLRNSQSDNVASELIIRLVKSDE